MADYTDRIRQLERLYADVNNRIEVLEKSWPSSDATTLAELRKQRRDYLAELGQLRRQQYDTDQRVDLDRDR